MTTTETPQPESMGIDPYEKNWMRFAIVLLVLFFAAITVAGFALGFQLPGVEQRVDPRTVTESGPFATPGVEQIGSNEYRAYVVAKQFLFDPNVIELPVGAKLTMYVTSADVQHGFKITDTNINMQIVPGQVSTLTYTFDRAGEYPIICHEFCGIGHAAMFATIKVGTPAGGNG
jgi:cytochrome c oxidase subunit 2